MTECEFTEPERYKLRRAVLEEAKRLICTERNKSYGEPTEDFKLIASLWSSLFSTLLPGGASIDIPSRFVAIALVLVKAARETHQGKLDNWVDMAGYSACGAECMEKEIEECYASFKSDVDVSMQNVPSDLTGRG